MNHPHRDSATPFAIWETAGTTEHLGGVSATRRLLELCHLVPGQTVLDAGCGTGYTACYLAQQYGTRVLAADVRRSSLAETGARISRATARGAKLDQITLLLADAHHLPCSDRIVDVVVAESVLVFCDARRVIAEFCRVLKPGGICAINELTLLAPPPPDLMALLVEKLGIRSYQSQEWQSLLADVGLLNVTATVRRISLWEQLGSHLQADGLSGYMRAVRRGLANAEISRVFINKAMLKAARKFVPVVGYGLYVGRKSG